MKTLVTFDVYSALFDIAGSIAPRVAERLSLERPKAEAFFAMWRDRQMERLQLSNSLGRERVPFRVATAQAFDYAAHMKGVRAPEAVRAELIASWDEIDPWPEAKGVVEAVKELGFLTAVLSNGDEAMLKAVARRIGDPFDHVFSSEHAGHYKPHPSMYRLPQERLGLRSEAILHVAGSRSDTFGAGAAGLDCYWSNRKSEIVLDPAFAPTYDRPDLSDVPSVLRSLKT